MPLTDSQPPPTPKSTSVMQMLRRGLTIAIAVAAIYVAWTFYSRHESDTAAQRALAAKQEAARQSEYNRFLGGGKLEITTFSISKRSITSGETASLCYGVVNAAKISIEPQVEDSKPSALHCQEVSPKTTTLYKLTASDAAGHTQTQSLTLEVH